MPSEAGALMTNELRGSGVTYGGRDGLGLKTALDFLPNRPTTTTVQTVAISHNITAILKVKSQVLSHLLQITLQNPW